MASASDLETPALRTRNAGVFLIRFPQNTPSANCIFSRKKNGMRTRRRGMREKTHARPIKKCGEMFGNISPPC